MPTTADDSSPSPSTPRPPTGPTPPGDGRTSGPGGPVLPGGPDGVAAPGGRTEAGEPGGIVVRGLARSFGAVRALDGVNLVARPGRVTALVGPNGSGKTTLLLVLAGLLVPDAGQVRVAGHDPVTDGLAARTRTGWMPDAFGTWDSLTAREVLTTFADAYRLPRAQSGPRVDALLATVHLTEYADRPASVLSRGQKQRLGLARALVHSPEVLLLDEPASGLDPRSRVDLRVLLRELAAAGTTVLVSSHVLSELDELADDAVFLSRGRTVRSDVITATAGAAGATGSAEPLAAQGRRTWHVRALSATALTSWLTSVGAVWRPDEAGVASAALTAPSGFEPPPGAAGPGAPAAPDGSGGVLLEIDGDVGAAALVRDAVAAGVPLVSIAPAGGALEQVYLTLDEERR
ncbi:ABC transporter ATP-binding protein [Cellulomonas hominis]